jgi:hypothetical protein
MTRRPLTRVGWAAAVAGLLGSSLPAPAQPLFQRGHRTAPVANAKAPGPALDAATLRLVQTRAQLAWLSDPVTFGYDLSLESGPRGLQISGSVPNEGVRQRAVLLATLSTGLSVADDLTVRPDLAVRCAGPVSDADLRREAAAVLNEIFGERAVRWRVSAGADGRVTVAGPCTGPDEQLQIARSLRRAAHCTCVSCQMTFGEIPWPPTLADRAPAAATPQPAPANLTQVAWRPDNAAPPVATTPGKAYETTGEILWETAPAAGKNTATSGGPAAGASEADRIRDAIRARCGADLSEVRVEILRDRRLHITLRVAPGADRSRVENQVLQLPDVANHPHGHFLD